jgi:hypothetical protein
MLMVPVASAANLTLQPYPLTGEMRLVNPSSTPFPFEFYEIKSPSGGLNGASAVWTSISDTYDASGNGFIDPVNNWTKLSSISTDLAEGVFVGAGSLPPFRSIGLGRIWNPNIASAASIVPTVVLAQGQAAVPMDKQLALDGDYNADKHVDQQDYSVWKIVFGTTNFPMADGNHNGVVDAADYTVWRDHLGQSVTLPNDTTPGSVTQADYDVWKSNFGNHSGSGSGVSAAVPEPASLLLLLTGILAICSRRCQKSRKLINV